MKIILVTAYDINPYKGSESGTGWNFVIQIARFNRVIAVTRENNKEKINQYIKEFDVDISNIEFRYFDLPIYLRFWKRGARGSSLYFYLWQSFIPLFVKKINFDIAHNLNFHTDSFPTFLWLLQKPVIWGPINHHEKIPYKYIYNIYSKKEYLKDRAKWAIKKIFWAVDPFLKISKKKSTLILCGNSSVQKRLAIPSNKYIPFSQIASEEIKNLKQNNTDIFNILFVGRLIPLKGADIAIRAFSEFYKKNNNLPVTLTIIGKGPEKNNLRSLARSLEIDSVVIFIDWIEKAKLTSYYQEANLFFFPSHEGAGMVLAEALSYSIPVLCFDNFGPGELVNDACAIRVPYSNYKRSISDFSKSLETIYFDKPLYKNMRLNALKLFNNKYTWDSKGDFLRDLYLKVD